VNLGRSDTHALWIAFVPQPGLQVPLVPEESAPDYPMLHSLRIKQNELNLSVSLANRNLASSSHRNHALNEMSLTRVNYAAQQNQLNLLAVQGKVESERKELTVNLQKKADKSADRVAPPAATAATQQVINTMILQNLQSIGP